MHSTAFEDNKGCIELATEPKFRPRTKHIALKYHFFQSWVQKGLIKVFHIDTKQQQGDIFTKPLERLQFQALRKEIMGW